MHTPPPRVWLVLLLRRPKPCAGGGATDLPRRDDATVVGDSPARQHHDHLYLLPRQRVDQSRQHPPRYASWATRTRCCCTLNERLALLPSVFTHSRIPLLKRREGGLGSCTRVPVSGDVSWGSIWFRDGLLPRDLFVCLFVLLLHSTR